MALYYLLIYPFSMCQGSLELHVLNHVILGPLSDVTHLTASNSLQPLHMRSENGENHVDAHTRGK